VIIHPASSLAQDRESSPVKDQCSTTVLRRQPILYCIYGVDDVEIAEMLEPPSYNVAVTLPTYDESLRTKQQEGEQQQWLCETAAVSSEVWRVLTMKLISAVLSL